MTKTQRNIVGACAVLALVVGTAVGKSNVTSNVTSGGTGGGSSSGSRSWARSLIGTGIGVVLAQSSDPAALARQLKERYDLVALADGVGLVPHERHAVRLIEIRDGAVALNGEVVTARELRTRVGRDADLILKVTYLTPSEQRALAGPAVTPTAPAVPAASGSAGAAAPGSGATAPTPAGADQSSAAPGGSADPSRTRVRRGDLVRIGSSVTVDRDELVQGDVVVIGGAADVDGEVTGDLVVVGGSLRLGPTAFVHGDLSVVGGSMNRDPGARVMGKMADVGVGEMGRLGERMGRMRGRDRDATPTMFPRVGRLVSALVRGVLLLLVSLLVVTLGGRYVDGVAGHVAAEPVRAGLLGLLGEVLFVPLLVVTVVVLAVSIIGIPLLLLLPFAFVLLGIVMLVGFVGVASLVGARVGQRFGVVGSPHATVAMGVGAIMAVTLLARLVGLAAGFAIGGVLGGAIGAVGYLVEYLAWTVGAGALILVGLDWRRRSSGTGAPTQPVDVPPAMPTPATGEGL